MTYPSHATLQSIRESFEELGINEKQLVIDLEIPLNEIHAILNKNDNDLSKIEKAALFYYLKWRQLADDYAKLNDSLPSKQ